MIASSDYGKTITHQFDSFCKVVLRNQARDIYDALRRRDKKFISLELLTQAELNQLSIWDKYESDYIHMTAYEFDIQIESLLIAQAIESLSKRQQDIILLSFFLNMKDVDIATIVNLDKSTVHYHRENGLKKLRKFMEEHTDET